MEANAMKAVSLQQAKAQLEYHTGKKVAASDDQVFQQVLDKQGEKIWDPKIGEAVKRGEQVLWGRLQAGGSGVSYVQRYGEFEASAVYTGGVSQTAGHYATSTNAANNLVGQFSDFIQQAALKYNVDPNLIQAVIRTESNFNPNAVSSAGAKGLMQLMDSTAKGLGVSNSFDPAQNIDGGTKYLAMLLKKYGGQTAVALAAYNAGPGRIDRLGITTEEDLYNKLESLPAETQAYIGKVRAAM